MASLPSGEERSGLWKDEAERLLGNRNAAVEEQAAGEGLRLWDNNNQVEVGGEKEGETQRVRSEKELRGNLVTHLKMRGQTVPSSMTKKGTGMTKEARGWYYPDIQTIVFDQGWWQMEIFVSGVCGKIKIQNNNISKCKKILTCI